MKQKVSLLAVILSAACFLAGCNMDGVDEEPSNVEEEVADKTVFELIEDYPAFESGTINIAFDSKNDNTTAKADMTITVVDDAFRLNVSAKSTDTGIVFNEYELNADLAVQDNRVFISNDTLKTFFEYSDMTEMYDALFSTTDFQYAYLDFDEISEAVGEDDFEMESVDEYANITRDILKDLYKNLKSGIIKYEDKLVQTAGASSSIIIDKDNIDTFKDMMLSFINSFDTYKKDVITKYRKLLTEEQFEELEYSLEELTTDSLADVLDDFVSAVTENELVCRLEVSVKNKVLTFSVDITSEQSDDYISVKISIDPGETEMPSLHDAVSLVEIVEDALGSIEVPGYDSDYDYDYDFSISYDPAINDYIR